ncbi:MAG: hypothetical protein JWR19_113 [Pedosphaera sp.]|nr:hypothetical protein [Pedosphaera sp.]
MTKVISAVIIILVLYGAWEGWLYWDNFSHDRDLAVKEAAANVVVPEQLAGMPNGMEPSYQAAVKGGPVAMKNWLRNYGKRLADPRLAWIELDYMIAIAHEDPVEAKKIFADVKNRVAQTSPVYSRIKQLEHTYE